MIEALPLGASLYVPATRPDVLAIGNRVKHPNLRSVIFCTEDAIHADEVPSALANLRDALRHFEPSPLLRFVRPRNAEVLRQLLQMDGAENLAGFVLPKVTRRNLHEYFACFHANDPHRVMIILETADVFDAVEMAALRALLVDPPIRNRVLSLRIGGNDLLQFLGLRRPRTRTIYATPLGQVIHQLVATFRPCGLNLTGPVCEWLDRDSLLVRETRRDVASGLFGKSAIHPRQVPLIESAYSVSMRDLQVAEHVLSADAPSVFRFDGAMCEPATHRAWASLVSERAKRYGVRNAIIKPRILPAIKANGRR